VKALALLRRLAPLRAIVGVALAVPACATEPPEYNMPYGEWSQGCYYCHGRPPSLPNSRSPSRIVAVGAAAVDAGALRRAMQRPDLGGAMDRWLDDPELTDARLDVIRRYLGEVRDGRLPATLTLMPGSAPVAVEFRSLRGPHDAPARIESLVLSGPIRLDPASTCRAGRTVPGLGQCTLLLRAAPAGASAAASEGLLTIRLARTPGLVPEPRRMTLAVGR